MSSRRELPNFDSYITDSFNRIPGLGVDHMIGRPIVDELKRAASYEIGQTEFEPNFDSSWIIWTNRGFGVLVAYVDYGDWNLKGSEIVDYGVFTRDGYLLPDVKACGQLTGEYEVVNEAIRSIGNYFGGWRKDHR